MNVLTDLFCSPESGKVSHTKTWTNIAYAVATGVVLVQAYKGTLATDMMLIYLAVVGAHGAASKWIAVRYGGGPTGSADQEGKA